MKKTLANKKGYTLIEMIVVVTIVSIILPVVFTILFVIMQQQMKIYRLIEVKKQGDFIMTFMRNKIETDAVKISSQANTTNEQCTNTSTTYQPTSQAFYFLDKNNQAFSFITTNGEMVLNNNLTGIQTGLTTSKVVIKNLTFSCFKRANLSTPLVQVSFTVEYKNLSTTLKPEETASLSYKTKIRLKSL